MGDWESEHQASCLREAKILVKLWVSPKQGYHLRWMWILELYGSGPVAETTKVRVALRILRAALEGGRIMIYIPTEQEVLAVDTALLQVKPLTQRPA